MNQGAYLNVILQKLDADAIRRLDLRPVAMPVAREIEFPGERIANLFFLEEGIASMTATFKDGVQVEIALAGFESVLGASGMMGTRRSLNRVYMQLPGCGYSSPTDAATREFKRGERFHDLTLRYLQAQFIQSAQTAGCNARHNAEQRMARWLLLCADRFGNRILPLSHEYLADMLGVRRATVTVAAGSLQDRNLIRYRHGKIELLDLEGLEKVSCECYRVVKNHLGQLASSDEEFGSE